MIDTQPNLEVALLQNAARAGFVLSGPFTGPGGRVFAGDLLARAAEGQIFLCDAAGRKLLGGREICLLPDAAAGAFFTVRDVAIGIGFHWQRTQEQSFCGALKLSATQEDAFHVINVVGLEEYLASVISSEMAAGAPLEFLKAQAVTARSWLWAMRERKKAPRTAQIRTDDEIAVWQDANDHEGFDVCADDHCQRYQGITRIVSENVARAIDATRGVFLVHAGEICDARYYKCCGGRTDVFSTAWEDRSFPYLQSVADGETPHPPVLTEAEAADWLAASPSACCNTRDKELLARILPAFDQETPHFYRWQVSYAREELEDLLKRKSGFDFGELRHLIALERGPSGRIRRLKIVGSKKTLVVGRELEIRRWLSESHLYSSAFVVAAEHDASGGVRRFTLHGGGWGHGVGLCQIGAAVMAAKGFKAEEILAHYFCGAKLRKLY